MKKLFLGDTIEQMKTLDDKSIDLILCDLPYGTTANKWDKIIDFNLLWEQYERIIKDNGAILLFAQGMFMIDLITSNKKLFKYDLVWDKTLPTGFLNAKKMPLRSHEQVLVFYKKLPTYNPQFSIGKPLNSRGHAFKTKEPVNNTYGKFKNESDERAGSTEKYPKSILSFKKLHPSILKHPTEKPVELLKYLIRTYSNEGDVVLDNTMGSGSTGLAALTLGRSFIGIELDEHYFNVATKRLENLE